jgi:hypothetical protein
VNIDALRKWLAEPRSALVAAVAEGVHAHVAALKSRGSDFYGYALHPGEYYEIHSLAAVTNTEGDISVPPTDSEYRQYRYSVDEWANWEQDGFAAANTLLVDANERFESMHTKDDGDFNMDEFEVAHADSLLEAIVRGLEVAKTEGAFGGKEPFLAVWFSDSDHNVIFESVRRLNSEVVVSEFMSEFG